MNFITDLDIDCFDHISYYSGLGNESGFAFCKGLGDGDGSQNGRGEGLGSGDGCGIKYIDDTCICCGRGDGNGFN